jgi:hypothetical protein
MNQPEMNLGAIRSGTVLIEKSALLPQPLNLEIDHFNAGSFWGSPSPIGSA